ncbi:GyrI-like domain-containing protein [Cohnella herbarum]|uniref:GyrI-like domain-containing protein n=1 Tax=Cohnella herbarum TaxID=2728023 RepID=A0A7Z2ZLC5_9BACL|nr:GyrI-like domain-containing protein [Cohnella herbarum]QJD82912.1 GyrI-like domain-containing protein [Cohnella herbarum]
MSAFLEKKGSFAVIGKLGQGFAADSQDWIYPLWQEANNNFEEIRTLAKTDAEGNIVGLWGAMSDLSESFKRWTDQGKYLAGCEVLENSIAPIGWTKWIVPSYKFAVMKCSQSTYQEIFNYMINDYLPTNQYTIVGAIHEFYNPVEANEELYLYFPIEERDIK